MTDTVLKSQAFKLKGRLYTFTVMQIVQSDVSAIAQQLADVIAKAPRLFINTPVVLDCSAISSEAIDFQAICQCLREFQLVPVAIQGGSSKLNTMAQRHGLGILNASSAQDKPLMEKSPEVEVAPIAESLRAKLFATPVRSGQQVVSKGRDLVVMASVSHGAELMSDGHIHVYGTLRGRALAGMMGDTGARIFCSSLEAELVSIAGYYLLCDTVERVKGPCQIYLKDDQIQIEPL